MIEVLTAPPFATIQDAGWRTGRAWGLPVSGAMDRASYARANALADNPRGAAAIEWALGAGTLRFTEAAVVGVRGWADVRVDAAGQSTPGTGDAGFAPEHALRVPTGGVLTITPDPRWRFIYVAVQGGIDVPLLMRSRSTYLPGGFGGFEGRRLRTGDRLALGNSGGSGTAVRGDGTTEAPGASPSAPARTPAPALADHLEVRVTRGPQWERFDAAARAAFFAGPYTVTPASDRMGYRLAGPVVLPREGSTLPSEAACPGAIQIPDGGQPIVLMPDGPTVGGYPKLAVVVRADLDRLAQCVPGAAVRFLPPAG